MAIPDAFRPLGRGSGGSSAAKLLLHLDAIQNKGLGQPHLRSTSAWYPVNNTGIPFFGGDMQFSAFGWLGGRRGLLQLGGVQKFNFEICFRLLFGYGGMPEKLVLFENNTTLGGGELLQVALKPIAGEVAVTVGDYERSIRISQGVNTVCLAENKILIGGDIDMETIEIPYFNPSSNPGEFWLGTDAPDHLSAYGDPVCAIHSLKIRDKPLTETEAHTAIAENVTRFSPTCAPVVFNPNGTSDLEPTDPEPTTRPEPTTNISCATPGAVIRVQYSNWMHDPFRFEEGIIATNPFPAHNGTSMVCRLKALASKDGMEDSPFVLSGTFLND